MTTKKEEKAREQQLAMSDMVEWATHFMEWLKKDFPSYKAELSPWIIEKRIEKFASVYKFDTETKNAMWDFIMRAGWIEVSAADTYILRHDLVRK